MLGVAFAEIDRIAAKRMGAALWSDCPELVVVGEHATSSRFLARTERHVGMPQIL
jgi:hypothetical protein